MFDCTESSQTRVKRHFVWSGQGVLSSSSLSFSALSVHERLHGRNKWEMNFQPGRPLDMFFRLSIRVVLQRPFVEEWSFKWYFSLNSIILHRFKIPVDNYPHAGWSWTSEAGSFFFFFFFPRVRRRAIFLTFILKCNETQGKVDPGVIILYNIPDDSPQKSNFGC